MRFIDYEFVLTEREGEREKMMKKVESPWSKKNNHDNNMQVVWQSNDRKSKHYQQLRGSDKIFIEQIWFPMTGNWTATIK